MSTIVKPFKIIPLNQKSRRKSLHPKSDIFSLLKWHWVDSRSYFQYRRKLTLTAHVILLSEYNIKMKLHYSRNFVSYSFLHLWCSLFAKKLTANFYLFKVNNGNTRKKYEICSLLTLKTTERRRTGDVVLVFLLYLWTYFTSFSSAFIVDFEQVNVSWDAHMELKETQRVSIRNRSSHPGVFLKKGVLKICSKAMQSNFIEIALRHGCSPVNLLHIFRTPVPRNTSGWLLLKKREHYRCF